MNFSINLLLLAIATSVVACVSPRGLMTVSETPPRSPTPSALQPVTRPIVLVSDSQIHESRGTASRYWSLAGDQFVGVTIRTGQQTIGAADILSTVMQREQLAPLTLHLGDAIDVSCEAEWDLYTAAMSGTKGSAGPRSWLWTPGNHDGFLVGNFFPLKNDLYKQSYWDEVCNTGRIYGKGKGEEKGKDEKKRRYRMSKNGVLNEYAKSLRLSGSLDSIEVDTTQCTGSPMQYCAYLHRSESSPWTSFMVQAVRLPSVIASVAPIFAILMDTSDFPRQPKLEIGGLLAGLEAGISRAQLQAIDHIMAKLPHDARVFFVGHHPFADWKYDTWTDEAKSEFDRFITHPRSLRLIVTAHTHEGGWHEHDMGGKTLLELNIGSLIDWPSHYRLLQFDADEQGRLHVTSPRKMLSLNDESCSFLVNPPEDSGYGIKDQQSESDRRTDSGVVGGVKAFLAALPHLFKFWQAKHLELRPQLLAYADVVEYSMPESERFSYRVPGHHAVKLLGKQAVAERLRTLGRCKDKVKCPAQEKETLLIALENYYWFDRSTSERVREFGHQYRKCAALWASRESALQNDRGQQLVEEIIRNTADESRLLPGRTGVSGELE